MEDSPLNSWQLLNDLLVDLTDDVPGGIRNKETDLKLPFALSKEDRLFENFNSPVPFAQKSKE